MPDKCSMFPSTAAAALSPCASNSSRQRKAITSPAIKEITMVQIALQLRLHPEPHLRIDQDRKCCAEPGPVGKLRSRLARRQRERSTACRNRRDAQRRLTREETPATIAAEIHRRFLNGCGRGGSRGLHHGDERTLVSVGARSSRQNPRRNRAPRNRSGDSPEITRALPAANRAMPGGTARALKRRPAPGRRAARVRAIAESPKRADTKGLTSRRPAGAVVEEL